MLSAVLLPAGKATASDPLVQVDFEAVRLAIRDLAGALDEVALYNAVLDQTTLQSHLTALIPAPSSLVLAAVGLGVLALCRGRRRRV